MNVETTRAYSLKAFTRFSLLATFAAISLAVTSNAFASIINYGDFDDLGGGGTVMYTDVTESSDTDLVPLYGAPTININLLDFDPQTFTANAGGGGTDITDGQLNYGLMSVPGSPISDIYIVEGGDYTLAGAGPGTLVGYGIGIRVTVTEIDGVTLTTPFDLVGSASGSKSLPGDAGITVPWSLDLSFDVAGELIAQQGFTFGTPYTDGSTDFSLGVTKAEVVIDDTLFAISRPASVAFIAKKNFTISTDTDPFDPNNNIPEPSTCLLGLLGAVSLGMIRNRQS